MVATRWVHNHIEVQEDEPRHVDVDVDRNKSRGFAGSLLRLACKHKMDFNAPNSKGEEDQKFRRGRLTIKKNNIDHFAVHAHFCRCARPDPCAELAVAGAATQD